MDFKRNSFMLRMESFIVSYFLVILCVLLVHGQGPKGEEKVLNCDVDDVNIKIQGLMRSMLFEDSDICCGNEKFKRGFGVNQRKYIDECNVPPKNETMCLEDSYWAFGECIIKKSLGSKELTQASFVEFLAQNLSNEKKSAILALANEMKPSPMVSNGNDQLQPIKSFWNGYFDAEYKVCTDSSTISKSSNETLAKFWDPSTSCKNGKFPIISIFPVTDGGVMKCMEAFENKYAVHLNSSKQINGYWVSACYFIQAGLITEDMLDNSNFDYKGFFVNFFPKFFSKSVKETILQSLLEQTKSKYSPNLKDNASAGFQEVAQEIGKSIQDSISNLETLEKKVMVLNAGTLSKMLTESSRILHNICGNQREPNK